MPGRPLLAGACVGARRWLRPVSMSVYWGSGETVVGRGNAIKPPSKRVGGAIKGHEAGRAGSPRPGT